MASFARSVPGDVVARQHADAMQKELGWSEERMAQELKKLADFYKIL
jgi:hypothetical protein